MMITEFLLILGTPILCIFGIICNILIIYVINKKENNRENLKEKHYTYMAINSFSNLVILVIEILKLMNECQYPFGFYCSSIRKVIFIQYNFLVFEFLSSSFRLTSNFTYVAFSLCRLEKIGKDHTKFIEFFSKLGIKKYMTFSIFISIAFSVVKPLRYDINYDLEYNDFPINFSQNHMRFGWQIQIKFILALIFDNLYDIVCNLLFVLANLIIDIVLIFKLRRVLIEKEEKSKCLDKLSQEKMKQESAESMRRVILMVILNSLIHFLSKIPLTITSLNDLRLQISRTYFDVSYGTLRTYHWFTFPYSMRYFCALDKICLLFRKFGNFLYLISISINLFFLKKFDKNFQEKFKDSLK
jgi:hypothetical protein